MGKKLFLDEVWGCQNHPKYHNSKPFLVGGYLWVPNYGIKVVFKQSAVRNSLLHQCKLTESNGYILSPHHIVHTYLHSSELPISICPHSAGLAGGGTSLLASHWQGAGQTDRNSHQVFQSHRTSAYVCDEDTGSFTNLYSLWSVSHNVICRFTLSFLFWILLFALILPYQKKGFSILIARY